MSENPELNLLAREISANLRAAGSDARRVFHGRGKYFDDLSHLNVEWYPPYLLVQNFGDPLDAKTIGVFQDLFDQNPVVEGVIQQSRIWPDFVATQICSEQEIELPISSWCKIGEGLECEISLGKNRNTGIFLDMRAGWDWVLNNSKDKRILNLFSYTGIFSLFALKGGASYVDNVDMAANVLKIAQRNHKKNELHDGQCAFFKRDVLKSDRWFEHRSKYDLIIADPPPYQKKAFRGWSDYSKLLKTCEQCLNPKGQILASLNNPQVSIDEYLESLQQLFPNALSLERINRAEEIRELDNNKGLKTVVVSF